MCEELDDEIARPSKVFADLVEIYSEMKGGKTPITARAMEGVTESKKS